MVPTLVSKCVVPFALDWIAHEYSAASVRSTHVCAALLQDVRLHSGFLTAAKSPADAKSATAATTVAPHAAKLFAALRARWQAAIQSLSLPSMQSDKSDSGESADQKAGVRLRFFHRGVKLARMLAAFLDIGAASVPTSGTLPAVRSASVSGSASGSASSLSSSSSSSGYDESSASAYRTVPVAPFAPLSQTCAWSAAAAASELSASTDAEQRALSAVVAPLLCDLVGEHLLPFAQQRCDAAALAPLSSSSASSSASTTTSSVSSSFESGGRVERSAAGVRLLLAVALALPPRWFAEHFKSTQPSTAGGPLALAQCTRTRSQ